MTEKVEPKKRNIQKLLAVALVCVSTFGWVTTHGITPLWPILFFAGLIWFIVLRILRD